VADQALLKESESMKLQLTDAEVTHLRKVLAWMRLEYMLDEDMQRGSLESIKTLLDAGDITQEDADRAVAKRADQLKQVPKYVRHGIKMLTQAVRDHAGAKGDVVDA
jgi:hypothetical protein